MDEETLNVNEELLEIFKSRRFTELKEKIADLKPYDIACFMDEYLDDDKELLVFFRILPKDVASDVFIELDTDTQEALIHKFTDTELKAVIDDMYLDDTVDIIEEMPANVVKRILKTAKGEDKVLINRLLQYPEDSAGSIMTPEFVALRPTMTVKEAFEKIKKNGINKETVYTCYVTNGKKQLIGVTTVKTLLLSEQTDLIGDIMETSVIAVDTLEDKEEVANKLKNYDFLALPVVDKEGCIVGIVTIDDAVDVISEEASEDIQKIAAILPTDTPYLKQSVWQIWLSRVPWLLVLMITGTFTSLILGTFEETVAHISTALIACIPMLMDTGGNAGSQASVTVIRSMALGDVELKDFLKVLWKELRVAFFLGLTIAIVCFCKLMLIDRLYNPVTWKVALVVSLTLFLTVMVAKTVGCLLPILAKKCRLDPAVVASPFITTIVDCVSLLIFCMISIALIQAPVM